ncbi:MAG: alpha-amylase, partial [Candidatus Aminicenantes bacterium]|nr:alpha-amylase [Candidatus Aminicenantes bacterium]
MFAFHVSRTARDAYGFDESFFVYDGRAVFADFQAVRRFAHRLNTQRPRSLAVAAGDINALGLIDEFRHAVFHAYRKEKHPGVLRDALAALAAEIGPDVLEETLRRFLRDFPPVAVYKGLVTIPEYLEATTLLPHRETALEEMLMLRLTNLNPAALPLRELFDDEPLARATAYLRLLDQLKVFFDSQPAFGPGQKNLIDLLAAPAAVSPHSLKGQLNYILAHWAPLLGGKLPRIISGLDLLREEERPSFGGPGPAHVPALGPGAQAASLALFGAESGPGASAFAGPRPPDPEPERFSPDLAWMPNLVLIAKNIHVWLDQLSRKYGRLLRRLDDIPDDELDFLQEAGITGLWLIGVWERSRASQRIKQLTGNPEAEASAYSLYDYAIASDLGGEPALADLRERAVRRGIRLASDMVPNHMGIDSRWVVDHPDWFIGLEEPPYPAYRFTGPDLSSDDRVAIRIEDRYYDRTDAAVVFERRDKWTGGVRYVYHGNDGTSFPWNDTAQLDYLKPEVREAVIRTILHVARLFPVIRFDAAMTLARRHLQRLWYPEPGAGGAIPSRSEHTLSREAFDAAVPVEFWREVVDRAAVEAPDTLLLAEAFWLMEGYFVRTLGMHRVYNSAFMIMLRDEDNAKYRKVIKDTLEFDPEVLKRYVNFMNNPDERTAVEQYGDGGKYFGICTMLATLPGLPMVGHGQVEGYKEKYGMEYRRAYYDETPRPDLLEEHRRRIFPLFHRRRLFAGVEHFLLYDFYRPEGAVDENVFAYSNGNGGERTLIVYHNRFAETQGWIRTSAAYAEKTDSGEGRRPVRKLLNEGLNVSGDPEAWVVFRDFVSGLEYIRRSRDLAEKGLDLKLEAYQCAVFEKFREVREDGRRLFSRIAAELCDRGVPDLERAAVDLWAGPVRDAFRELVHPGFLEWLMGRRVWKRGGPADIEVGSQVEEKAGRLAAA